MNKHDIRGGDPADRVFEIRGWPLEKRLYAHRVYSRRLCMAFRLYTVARDPDSRAAAWRAYDASADWLTCLHIAGAHD